MAVDSLPDFSDMGNHPDRTGPHFISSVFRTYTREHPQYPPEHTNGVYLTTAEYFSPAIGPDQLGFFRDVCESYKSLSVLKKRACQRLEKLLLKVERLAMAFADHLWTHTYTNMVKVPSDQFQPIQTLLFRV